MTTPSGPPPVPLQPQTGRPHRISGPLAWTPSGWASLSIQAKLPLLMGLVWLLGVAALGGVAYAHVARAERTAAAERLETVTGQFAGLLHGNAKVAIAAARAAARDPVLAAYLANPSDSTRAAAARVALSSPPAQRDRLAAVSLWTADGRRLITRGPAAGTTDASRVDGLFAAALRDTGAVGPLQTRGDSLLLVAVAPIRQQQRLAGYLAQWMYVGNSAAQHEQTVRLIGRDAELYVGARNGGIWTDLMHVVPRPPIPDTGTGQILRYTRRDSGARLAYVEAVPGTPWSVVVEFSEPLVLEPARRFRDLVILVGVVVFVLGVAGAWLLTRRITRRLGRLTDAAESISAAGDGPELPSGGDEVARLGVAFARMATRVDESQRALQANLAELQSTREQFAHAQRLEAVGRLAGGVAHDFNNLLTVILSGTELALPDAPAANREVMEDIRDAAERARSLTSQLLAFSRRQISAPRPVDLNALVLNLDRMLGRLVGEHISLSTRAQAERATVRIDPGQVEQVIVNLVVNSCDAMPRGGSLLIETRTIELSEEYVDLHPDAVAGEYVMVTVGDSGTGMSEEAQRHLFEPFFTTKEQGTGTGLGLATSYGIVRQNGGHISVETEADVGTTVRVYLPLVQETAEPAVSVESTLPVGSETILLVEDEAGVRRATRRILQGRGYRVLAAATAEAALTILQDDPGRIDLLLTDVVLPGMGGRELAERVRRLRPEIRLLFASGYTDDAVLQDQLVDRRLPFIQKPFTLGEISRKVRQVLDQPPPD